MHFDVLILGASTRAAAFSALRCGLKPRCADYFADRDLAAVCDVDRIDPRHAVREFIELAESLPPLPWFYTGGFENHPAAVDRIACRHPLWAIDGHTLRRVRNPSRVAEALSRRGIPCPGVRLSSDGLPRDGTWLRKPLRSGGGRGIEPLLAHGNRDSAAHYFQERIAGPSFSSLFMGNGGGARLVGITRQLIGVAGSPFLYRGSVGPLPLAEPLAGRLQALGDALAGDFGLRGWFGVDYILRDQIPWPVEINPRYTASVEIYELASGQSLLAEHRSAWAAGATAPALAPPSNVAPGPVIAKRIFYAPRRLVAPEIVADENESNHLLALPSVADVPWPGTCINPGEPVMTLMAAGADLEECRSRLVRLVNTWNERLGNAGDDLTIDAAWPCAWHSGDDDAFNV